MLPEDGVNPELTDSDVYISMEGALKAIVVQDWGGAPRGASRVKATLEDAGAGLPEGGESGLPAEVSGTTLI